MRQNTFLVWTRHQVPYAMRRGYSLAAIAGTCFLLGFSQMAFAGENSTYQQQALRLIDQADEIFISKGICLEKRRDCSKKELILFGLSASGIEIEIYDEASHVANEIVGLCFAEYERNNRRMSISVYVYKQLHRDRVNKLFSLKTPKPYIEMHFRGEQ